MTFTFCDINHGKFSIQNMMKHQSLIKEILKAKAAMQKLIIHPTCDQWGRGVGGNLFPFTLTINMFLS